VALLWKMICNLGDPMSLRHSVVCTVWVCVPFFFCLTCSQEYSCFVYLYVCVCVYVSAAHGLDVVNFRFPSNKHGQPRIGTCNLSYSYVWVLWKMGLIRMWDMTHSYVCYDSFICMPWLIHMCMLCHSHVWHMCECCERTGLMSHIKMSHVSHKNESCHT